jgi:hypothetical protein
VAGTGRVHPSPGRGDRRIENVARARTEQVWRGWEHRIVDIHRAMVGRGG